MDGVGYKDPKLVYLHRRSIRGRNCVGRAAPMTTLLARFCTTTYLDSPLLAIMLVFGFYCNCIIGRVWQVVIINRYHVRGRKCVGRVSLRGSKTRADRSLLKRLLPTDGK